MASTPLDRADGAPLWSQLQDDLVRRIGRGEFTARFPGELDLVREYGVSRTTVRQALARLRADRVVTAERGRPPRVDRPVRPEIAYAVGSGATLFDVIERSGRVHGGTVRSLVRTHDGVVATRLGLEESTPLLHLERLRSADGEPLAWDRVWLPFDLAAPLLGRDLARVALYDELARLTGVRVDEGRERIRADTADAVRARLLGVDVGAPVFRIDRNGAHAGRLVEWRQTVVRADRFVLTADLGGVPDRTAPVVATA